MRQSGEMDWVSGLTGAAAGASGMLSALKIWAKIRPKVPLQGMGAEDYVLKQIREQGKLLKAFQKEMRAHVNDMNARISELEGR